ncbi:MAG: M23 family peptidase, partial [Muribaculaceae bacterium]|nr:M23 family peptidase [Muribaculaceae bacterium]
MARKTFYRYNPATDSYERVYPSARQRLWSVLRQTIIGVAAGVGVAIAAYYIIDFPREKQLRDENHRLRSSVELLNRRSDRAIDVMEDIMTRDNNFYRVMLQTDPVPPSRRLAGLERPRLYEEYDTMP